MLFNLWHSVIFSEKWQYLMKGSELVSLAEERIYGCTHTDLTDFRNPFSQADSITINPHKLLNVPHQVRSPSFPAHSKSHVLTSSQSPQCSYLIIRRGTALNANALSAAYLFHGASLRDNAGLKTMGCGRRGDALKFYLAWQRYGRTGFGAHVDAGFTLARRVVDYVRKQADVELGPMPEDLFLQVCFRPALPAQEQERMDRTAQNERASTATRYVHATLRERKRFAVDFAPLPDDAGDFIR